ncbi:MAG: hypothetical protein AAB401_06480 [Acidobacteriota bacterium]
MQPRRNSIISSAIRLLTLLLLVVMSIASFDGTAGKSHAAAGVAMTKMPLQIFGAPVTVNLAIVQDPVKDAIVKILNDRTLFGKDLPAALAYLPSWSQINERQVEIYPDRIVGSLVYKTTQEAQQAAARLREATAGPRLTPNPEFADLLRGVPNQFPFSVEVIPYFPDDGSIRVAWTAPVIISAPPPELRNQAQQALQFFDPALKAAAVQQRVGPPDAINQEIVQSDKDERPVILTKFSYAKGAIDFAEADLSPRPGFVDRVLFNVTAVTSVVFVSGPR